MTYCPLMLITNGLHGGDSPDARAMNKSRQCRADCAWRIGDDCAMVVLAKTAVTVGGSYLVANGVPVKQVAEHFGVSEDEEPRA